MSHIDFLISMGIDLQKEMEISSIEFSLKWETLTLHDSW